MITSIICWAITLSYFTGIIYVMFNYGLSLTNTTFLILIGIVVIQITKRLDAKEKEKNSRYIDLN